MYMHWLFGVYVQCTICSLFLGSVKLLKGSVASSPREKRNARKRSFEQCLSATAAKILKMEEEKQGKAAEGVTGRQKMVWSSP